jgi:putative SOS response-associated peptidase YedK
MCGRFVRKSTLEQIADAFDLDIAGAEFDLAPSFNIAPGQQVAAVVFDGRRKLKRFRWGLIPSWAKDEKIGYKMINARAETVAEKPGFRQAFSQRRCIVVADGFYEWKHQGPSKIPYYVRLKKDQPLGFAGLYEHWRAPDGKPVDSCAIITTAPNALMKPIHDRMPVILDQRACGAWLDPAGFDADRLRALLQPFDPGKMDAYPVGLLVNSPKNNGPRCIEPVGR